jgi:hypothetical protein
MSGLKAVSADNLLRETITADGPVSLEPMFEAGNSAIERPANAALYGSHAAATSLVHRNSVPSTQMRCMITANRRARATIAFFIPRRLAICIAQALSQDHFFERSML